MHQCRRCIKGYVPTQCTWRLSSRSRSSHLLIYNGLQRRRYRGGESLPPSLEPNSQIQRPILAPETDNGPPKNKFHYEGLQETSTVLPNGHQKVPGASAAAPCDVRFDRDVKVALRDGTRIRVDIFRPADLPADAKIPAIVAWSPYGNHGVGFPNLECTCLCWSLMLDPRTRYLTVADLPYRACVPESRLVSCFENNGWSDVTDTDGRRRQSGYEKFEGPCPYDFVPRGYALVNADSRGTWDSEGDMVFPGTQEGRDGADLVDWVGEQEWCNGKVGMAGNSWLARAIWFVSAAITDIVLGASSFPSDGSTAAQAPGCHCPVGGSLGLLPRNCEYSSEAAGSDLSSAVVAFLTLRSGLPTVTASAVSSDRIFLKAKADVQVAQRWRILFQCLTSTQL